MINFNILDGRYTAEALGLIPMFLSRSDGRPAAEQFDDNYQHGGGWRPMAGWKLGPVGEILYKHDTEALRPIAVGQLADETIYIYPGAWVAITQPDGSYEVSRMD